MYPLYFRQVYRPGASGASEILSEKWNPGRSCTSFQRETAFCPLSVRSSSDSCTCRECVALGICAGFLAALIWIVRVCTSLFPMSAFVFGQITRSCCAVCRLGSGWMFRSIRSVRFSHFRSLIVYSLSWKVSVSPRICLFIVFNVAHSKALLVGAPRHSSAQYDVTTGVKTALDQEHGIQFRPIRK